MARLNIPIVKLKMHIITPMRKTFCGMNLSQNRPAVYAPIALPKPTKINEIVKNVDLLDY